MSGFTPTHILKKSTLENKKKTYDQKISFPEVKTDHYKILSDIVAKFPDVQLVMSTNMEKCATTS